MGENQRKKYLLLALASKSVDSQRADMQLASSDEYQQLPDPLLSSGEC